MKTKIEKLEDDYSDAKDNYLAAAHDVALARVAACDAGATFYDGSNADVGVNEAIGARNSARIDMFSAAKDLDIAIDNKEDE